MAFGDSVKALLDTYANCISLLKAFGRGRQENGSMVDAHHQHSRLRKSLRSDRSLVERAYSARLSEAGSRLKKGDTRAITALDRILKRLRNAIKGLLRLSSKRDGLDLDYQSLMTLSNASRTEAIKAIDSLSRRLGSHSRSSVVPSSSAKASSKGSSSRRRRKSSSRAESATHGPSKEPRQEHLPSKKSSIAVKGGEKTSKAAKGDPERTRKSPPSSSPPPPKSPGKAPQIRTSLAMRPSPKSPKAPETPKMAVPNRISILSFSSDSTKLGEIPERKWRSVMHYSATDPDGDEYNVRPVFPLKPYTVEVRERRFFGLFSRKREG